MEDMANNRMILSCSKCCEDFGLAKYYPSSGWYTSLGGDTPTEREEKAIEWFIDFQEFLEKHSHDSSHDMDGNRYIEFSYEQSSVLPVGAQPELEAKAKQRNNQEITAIMEKLSEDFGGGAKK